MSRASYVTVDEITLQNTADAIRAKTGKSAAMYPSQFATEIGKIPAGQEYAPADAVRFIDYDGTLLYSYSAAEFLALSTMPTQPTHTGLTSQGWTYSFAGAQSYVEKWGFLDIGALYDITSGNDEIDVKIIAPKLSIYLTLGVNGTVDIDWGDESTHDSVTGTSPSTYHSIQHTYSTGGDYTIVLSGLSGSKKLNLGNSTYPIIHGMSNTNVNRSYSACIIGLKLSSHINYVYGSYLTHLKYMIISNTAEPYFSSTSHLYHLKAIIIPNNSIVSLPLAQYLYNLEYFCLPENYQSTLTGSLADSTKIMRFIMPENCPASANNLMSRQTTIYFEVFIIPNANLKITVPYYNLDLTGETDILPYQYLYARIQNVTIPSTVTNWSNNFTFYFSTVESITINSSVVGTLASSYRLEQITFSNNNLTAPSNFLQYCYGLNQIDLSKFTSLNNNICANCESLETVTLKSSLTSLPTYAFQRCYSLKTITLPTSLTTIGNNCFYLDFALCTITIPSTVTSIGTQAFYNCCGLMEIHLKPTTPPTITNTNVFYNVPSTCVFYVPTASLDTYKTTNYWSTWASQMVGE